MVSMPSPFHRGRPAALAASALLLALAIASQAVAAATLEARVDRQVVRAGETLRLTLRYGGDAPPARPDLRPLADDFEILGTEQSQHVSVVNGRVEQTREIDVLLSPLHSGTLTIPSLEAGDLATAPLTLTVLDAGAASLGAGARPDDATAAAALPDGTPDLFVQATADQTSPFVQGEVGYTVRVYDGIGIREGALTEPAVEGVRIEPRGDTRTFEQVVNGRPYVVHERSYALFPQTSGEVTVPPVILQARVPDAPGGRGARRSAFDDAFGDDAFAEMFAQMRAGGFAGSLLDRMMSPGRELRVRSNPVTLSVQGRPTEAASGWFLPARSVELAQSWSPAEPTFRVGETVRRTVTLRADGASTQQLPELEVAAVDGVKQYPGQSEQRNVPAAGGGAAELVQTFDLLPARAGTFTLPAIAVRWWDVEAKVQRTASLPAQTIEVLAAPGGEPAQAASAAPALAAAGAATASAPRYAATADATSAHDTTALASAPAAAATPDTSAALLGERWLVAGGTLLLALLGTALWWVARRGRTTPAAAAPDASRTAPRVPARALVDALHQACTANDARAVRDALRAWGRATWTDATPANPAQLAARLGHAGFARAVKALDDSLYAPSTAPFDGAALWREFEGARRAAGTARDGSAEILPALYPDSRLA